MTAGQVVPLLPGPARFDPVSDRQGVLYVSAVAANVGNDPSVDDGSHWWALFRA